MEHGAFVILKGGIYILLILLSCALLFGCESRVDFGEKNEAALFGQVIAEADSRPVDRLYGTNHEILKDAMMVKK